MSDALTRDTEIRQASDGGDRAIPLGAGGEEGLVSRAEDSTSQTAGATPGEVIEPGRALALADFAPPSLGAGERLLRLAYRFGVPASMLTSPLGKSAKPRILATVTNPLVGNKVAAAAAGAGPFAV